jgi:hypothetical protein
MPAHGQVAVIPDTNADRTAAGRARDLFALRLELVYDGNTREL